MHSKTDFSQCNLAHDTRNRESNGRTKKNHWAHTSLPNGILIGSAVFAQFTRVPNTQTHGDMLEVS